MAEPAARLLDPIAHTESMTGFLTGLAVGIAVGVAVIAVTVATGGAALAVVAAAGGAMATAGGGALLGQSLGATYEKPTGNIVQVGSQNVLINSRPATRAMLDAAVCSTHAPGPPKPIAQGAEMVLINGMPAARKTSLIACGARISGGSPDVLIGGPTATLVDVSPEVPAWMTTTASMMVLVGGVVALGAGAAAAFVASGLSGLASFAVRYTRAYRAVSRAEFDDIVATGRFNKGPNSLEGKWFADHYSDVLRHGDGLEGPGNYRVVEADLPNNAPSLYRAPNLDNRGPARFLHMDDLQGVRPRPYEPR